MLSRVFSSPVGRICTGLAITGGAMAAEEGSRRYHLGQNDDNIPTLLKVANVAEYMFLGATLSPLYVPVKIYHMTQPQLKNTKLRQQSIE